MTGPTRRQCYRGAKIWPVWSLPWRTGRATRGEDDASRHCLADRPLRGLLWRPPISDGWWRQAQLSACGQPQGLHDRGRTEWVRLRGRPGSADSTCGRGEQGHCAEAG